MPNDIHFTGLGLYVNGQLNTLKPLASPDDWKTIQENTALYYEIWSCLYNLKLNIERGNLSDFTNLYDRVEQLIKELQKSENKFKQYVIAVLKAQLTEQNGQAEFLHLVPLDKLFKGFTEYLTAHSFGSLEAIQPSDVNNQMTEKISQ